MTIEGVTGYGYAEGHREISVYFDPAIVERAELDERVRAAGIAAVRTDEDAA